MNNRDELQYNFIYNEYCNVIYKLCCNINSCDYVHLMSKKNLLRRIMIDITLSGLLQELINKLIKLINKYFRQIEDRLEELENGASCM